MWLPALSADANEPWPDVPRMQALRPSIRAAEKGLTREKHYKPYH